MLWFRVLLFRIKIVVLRWKYRKLPRLYEMNRAARRRYQKQISKRYEKILPSIRDPKKGRTTRSIRRRWAKSAAKRDMRILETEQLYIYGYMIPR